LQVDIAEYSASESNAEQFISVPSYYSNDQILIRTLGDMPANYWLDFGKLDDKFDIFWTGDQILSLGYDRSRLEK